MAEIRTTKLEAARRQTDAAIRMLFGDEDAFAVHTVASAAFRILRDLAERHGNVDWHEETKLRIRGGMERRFWRALDKAANFLKHADQDPDDTLEVEEEVNDCAIFYCCVYYKSLASAASHEMNVFLAWISAMYPEWLLDSNPAKALVTQPEFDQWRREPREKRLARGRQMLSMPAVDESSR